MKVTIFGSGYVGLVTGACLAEAGNHVVCVDVDAQKIERLNAGEVPIHEPGLDALIKRNREGGRLEFTTDSARGVEHGLFQLIAVGTPPGRGRLRRPALRARGRRAPSASTSSEYTHRRHQVDRAGGHRRQGARAQSTATLAARGAKVEFDVVSNPEFLKEGAAIADFMKPDRVVVGTDSPRTTELMRALYEPFTRNHDRLIVMDVRSAELTKYAANAMLATKISFMNELANLAERVGADIENVRLGIGSDPRIGYSFIYPGAGYGGSCFPKDVQALIRSAREVGYEPQILKAVEAVNNRQKQVLFRKLAALTSRRARGRKHRALGSGLQAEYRRHARGAEPRSLIELLSRPARRCAPTIRWRCAEAQRIYGERRELHARARAPTRRARGRMRWPSSPNGRSSAARTSMRSSQMLQRRRSSTAAISTTRRRMAQRSASSYYAIGRGRRAAVAGLTSCAMIDSGHSVRRRRHAAVAAVARAVSRSSCCRWSASAPCCRRRCCGCRASPTAAPDRGLQRGASLPGRRAAAQPSACTPQAIVLEPVGRNTAPAIALAALAALEGAAAQPDAPIRCCWCCPPIT